MPSPVLLFDLDHTLVHTEEACLDPRLAHFRICDDKWCVHVRPHAFDLLNFLLANADAVRIGFWTAGTLEYGWQVVSGLFAMMGIEDWPRHIVLLRGRSTTHILPCGSLVKPLATAERACATKRILLVDDDVVHYKHNPGRVLRAPPFVAGGLRARRDRFLAKLKCEIAEFL